ncbi:PQQ-like beta-propeller repeat protein [Streptosporangium sp. NBC_01755]|uniref:outer membrane protein assembly factor BamB family protein n=1 Tax=Streptosporangium sp. NBC_01755 TaxID=2975949 RepID=UPI002DDC7005|nr:PQQ-binding-like beta-propeller repeat protein [Streptosporangium sp. NBC_01755]WSC98973.1 PQQ-like beta-propeller repeat protein [Streptosporangium sp. NBC_01755]
MTAQTPPERWRYAPAGASVQGWASAGATLIVKTLRPSPSGDVVALTGLSRATGTPLWSRERLDLGSPLSTWTEAEETPPVGLAWDAAARTLLGLAPETGRTRWAFRLPPSCGRIHTASSGARTTAIVALCEKSIRVIALDPDDGTERWSTGLTSFFKLYVRGGVVVVSRPENLLIHDAVTGQVIAERVGCWDGCAAVHIGGRIVVTRDQDGASTVEGIDPADGSAEWTRVQRNGPRYDWLAGVGATVYATPSGDDLGRILDVIQPSTGDLRRMPVPTAGQPFDADGDRLYVLQTVRSAARPSRLRITALRVPDRLTGAAPAAEPVAVPGAELCDLLRTAGFTVLGEARHRRRAVPSFTTCEFREAGGEPMTAEFWRLPTEAGAARVLAGLGAADEGEPVFGVGDEARVVGVHGGRAVIVRAGRDLARIRSPYLTVRDRLVPVARAVAERLGSLRWAVPASWSPVAADGEPPSGRTSRLPGTRFQIHDDPEAPVTLSAYNVDERGPTYLRDGEGFTPGRERMKAVSPDGRWAAADFKDYVDGHDGVVLLDRHSGRIRRITTVKAPLVNNTPVWSSGGRLLLTLWRNHEDYSVSIGFVVVDPARGTFEITSTEKDEDTYEYPYRWSADESGASSHFGIGDFDSLPDGERIYASFALRTYGTGGTVLSTLSGQGKPDDEILDPYSPSRRRLVGWCPDRPEDLCVRDATTGTLLARIEADLRYPIRWYDEDHLLVWRRYVDGHAASVMDLYGQITTDLARSSSTGRDGVKLFYVPR